MKVLIALLMVLGASAAHANDGSTPYINVLGINPNGNASDSKIEVYGKEMGNFFEVLPVNFVYADEARAIHFYSKSWALSIWCSKSYERPSNGELRDDHMCTFTIYTTGGFTPETGEWEGDSYNVVDSPEQLGVLADKSVDVLGVNPVGVKTGTVYSFYGKQTSFVAKNLIGNGITFNSNSYKVSLNCQKDYIRPSTGEKMSDYMCSLSLGQK